MTEKARALCVAVDGGTTNTRARLFRGTELLAAAARPVGIRDAAMGRSTHPIRQAVAESLTELLASSGVRLDELDLLCASGMLTSDVGLCEVPHVLAPAGLDELARNVVPTTFPDIAPRPIYLVPGVKTISEPVTTENLSHLDMLRGEESEVFGIVASGRKGPLSILLPGSHTKLVHIDTEARIAGSYTTIGGELMQTVAERTILASSIDWPPAGQPCWSDIDHGVQFAARWGLLRGGFAVRLAQVLVDTDRRARTWFFVGLVVGTDWNELARWPGRERDGPLLVGGREPLRSIYGHVAHAYWQGAVEILPDWIAQSAAALGAISIARHSANEARSG